MLEGVEKKPKYEDEMAYFGLIVMGWSYDFLGEHAKAEEVFKLASEFSKDRNENLLYLAFHYDSLGKTQEAIQVIDKMMEPERKNPFPVKSFLIESRAYTNTGNFLVEYKERLTRKTEEHVIDSESFNFDFK
jgi:tetratricopeptide (TPR) repeat protein